MKKTIFVLALMMAAAASFAATNNSVSIIYPVLDIGAGARAMGMGEAYTAVADDASAVYWNAAGLGTIKNIQVALTYDKWFVDTMFSQAMFAYPLSAGTIGADIVYMNLGELKLRDIYGAGTGTVNPYVIGGSVGYGISFGDVSAGAALKVITQSTNKTQSAAFAGDAGAMYRMGIFSAGLNLQNMGVGSGYSLPMNIKAGVAIKPVNLARHGLLIALDTQCLFKDAFSLSAGAEYVYDNMLAARLGYKFGFSQTNLDGIKGLSGGVGVKAEGFSFDYAVALSGDLGIAHRATLSYGFGGPAVLQAPENIPEKDRVMKKK